MKQCKACPWKVSTNPNTDIPNGYSKQKHRALRNTLAEPCVLNIGALRVMACHESNPGREMLCVGWVHHQLNAGNNIALRFLALDGRFKKLELDGEQHTTFEATLGERT